MKKLFIVFLKTTYEDIYNYIKSNLYEDEIVISYNGNNHYFSFNFTPQRAGTITQNSAYQDMKIKEFTDIVIEKLQKS
tara:strand:- start:2301 stop:2534 length:234 start_codon:yes stop_codon:yes gene_type:complete